MDTQKLIISLSLLCSVMAVSAVETENIVSQSEPTVAQEQVMPESENIVVEEILIAPQQEEAAKESAEPATEVAKPEPKAKTVKQVLNNKFENMPQDGVLVCGFIEAEIEEPETREEQQEEQREEQQEQLDEQKEEQEVNSDENYVTKKIDPIEDIDIK